MDWRESVSKGFPRRNRDEPPSLRRDIEDELADHLANAFACEIERTFRPFGPFGPFGPWGP